MVSKELKPKATAKESNKIEESTSNVSAGSESSTSVKDRLQRLKELRKRKVRI